MNPMMGSMAFGPTNGRQAESPLATMNQTCNQYQGSPTPPEAPIREAVSAIEQSLAEAHGGLSAIMERLDVVLRASPPEVTKAEQNRASGRTHLETRLIEIAAAIRVLNMRMQDLHGRIDV